MIGGGNWGWGPRFAEKLPFPGTTRGVREGRPIQSLIDHCDLSAAHIGNCVVKTPICLDHTSRTVLFCPLLSSPRFVFLRRLRFRRRRPLSTLLFMAALRPA